MAESGYDPLFEITSQWRERVIRRINYTLFFAAIAYQLTYVIRPFVPLVSVLLLACILMTGGIHYLIRQERVRTASNMLVYSLWLIITAGFVFNSGFDSPYHIINVVALIVGILLLERRMAIVFVALNILVQIVLYLTTLDILPSLVIQQNPASPTRVLILKITVFVLTGVIMLGTTQMTNGLIIDLQQQQLRNAEINADLLNQREKNRQAEKMTALGRLAGAVSHDFNNILTTISGYVELSRLENSPEELESNLDEIDKATKRAKDVTRTLLTLAKKEKMEFVPRCVNCQIKEMKGFLEKLVRREISLSYELSKDTATVLIDEGMFTQIVMNLVVNANEAIPSEGQIEIRTRREGPHVILQVIDDGPGIPENIVDQIYEPFFSTKAGNSGIGLSTVYNIVDQFGAEISLKTGQRGTSFTIRLPLEGKPEPVITTDPPLLAERESATFRILLAEDEEGIRAILKRSLELYGHQIETAEDGQVALDMLKQDPDGFDLLLTDVRMPNLNGPDLAQLATRYNASLKIIFMSGYPKQDLMDILNIPDGEVIQFIEKPFLIEDVLQAISRAE